MLRNTSRMTKHEFGNETKYYRWKTILHILTNMVCKMKIDTNTIFVIIMYAPSTTANLHTSYVQEITDPKLTGSHYLSGIILNSGCNKYTGN